MMSTEHAIEMPTVITQTGPVVSADVDDGEKVMMSVEQGMYYGVDAVGSRIWELIEHPVSVSQLCDTLQEEFDVSCVICQQDVLNFLRELQKDALIEIRSPE